MGQFITAAALHLPIFLCIIHLDIVNKSVEIKLRKPSATPHELLYSTKSNEGYRCNDAKSIHA